MSDVWVLQRGDGCECTWLVGLYATRELAIREAERMHAEDVAWRAAGAVDMEDWEREFEVRYAFAPALAWAEDGTARQRVSGDGDYFSVEQWSIEGGDDDE